MAGIVRRGDRPSARSAATDTSVAGSKAYSDSRPLVAAAHWREDTRSQRQCRQLHRGPAMSDTMSTVVAPSAVRMPISRVRAVVRYDTRVHPTADRMRASPAKAPTSPRHLPADARRFLDYRVEAFFVADWRLRIRGSHRLTDRRHRRLGRTAAGASLSVTTIVGSVRTEIELRQPVASGRPSSRTRRRRRHREQIASRARNPERVLCGNSGFNAGHEHPCHSRSAGQTSRSRSPRRGVCVVSRRESHGRQGLESGRAEIIGAATQ